MRIGAGERVAVVGGNGAGKTTLLRASWACRPIDGSVTVGGRAVRRAEDAVEAGVGHRLPEPRRSALRRHRRRGRALRPRATSGSTTPSATGAWPPRSPPLGIGALAARPIEELSFGEKKRACLAGVLAMRPRVLLLDEPTAGLDPAGEEALVALLAGIDATMVIATHAVDLVPRLCARTVVLGRGGIVADGPTAEVMARGDELRACNLRPPYAYEARAREVRP